MTQKPCPDCGMSMDGHCSHPRCPGRKPPTTCHKCRDTGIQHRAPYLTGLPDGDLYTMTACDCPVGKQMVREAMQQKEKRQ